MHMPLFVGDKLGPYAAARLGRPGIPSASAGAWVGLATSPGGFANPGGTLMDFTLE
jgi:hypothetical protein